MQYGICSIGQKMKTYYTCALSYQALEPGLATYPVNALLCLRQRKAHYSVFYFLFFLFGALNEDFFVSRSCFSLYSFSSACKR